MDITNLTIESVRGIVDDTVAAIQEADAEIKAEQDEYSIRKGIGEFRDDDYEPNFGRDI